MGLMEMIPLYWSIAGVRCSDVMKKNLECQDCVCTFCTKAEPETEMFNQAKFLNHAKFLNGLEVLNHFPMVQASRKRGSQKESRPDQTGGSCHWK